MNGGIINIKASLEINCKQDCFVTLGMQRPSKLPFATWAHLEEIKLRGTYVNMAVDVDFIVAMIIFKIYESNIPEIKTLKLSSGGKNKELQDLTMFEKIDVCKQGLQKYHSHFYTSHLADIESLDKLRDFRNKLAHQKMDIKETNKNVIILSRLAKNSQVESNEYDLKALWAELLKYRQNIMNILNLIQSFIISPPSSSSQP